MPSQTQQVETILKLNVDYGKGIKADRKSVVRERV
jgi:hypothetical protein